MFARFTRDDRPVSILISEIIGIVPGTVPGTEELLTRGGIHVPVDDDHEEIVSRLSAARGPTEYLGDPTKVIVR